MCYNVIAFSLKGREGVKNMTNADLFWNLLQMYLAEKERNSKKEENTNDKDDECKKLHSQKN